MYYHYRVINGKYLLFSSGQDGVPQTADDLFPQVWITDGSKIGWIKMKFVVRTASFGKS
jgi:hypothetical protein